MKLIQLTRGKFAKVDDEDYPELSKYNWYYDKGYAKRKVGPRGKQTTIHMHRFLMKAKKGQLVDHRDNNPSNNQKNNLRIVDHSKNAMNMKKQLNRSSVYKGVAKDGKIYRTVIWKDNKKAFNASCRDEGWAAMIYDLNAAALFGEYARLNFPGAILVVQG